MNAEELYAAHLEHFENAQIDKPAALNLIGLVAQAASLEEGEVLETVYGIRDRIREGVEDGLIDSAAVALPIFILGLLESEKLE